MVTPERPFPHPKSSTGCTTILHKSLHVLLHMYEQMCFAHTIALLGSPHGPFRSCLAQYLNLHRLALHARAIANGGDLPTFEVGAHQLKISDNSF